MRRNMSQREVLARYPRVIAHMIAESLGYFTPLAAADCLLDHISSRKNYCEYIASCFECEPTPMVRQAIRFRANHTGFMSSYKQALAVVMRSIRSDKQPLFASWF